MSEQFTSKTYSDLYEKVDRLKSLLSEARGSVKTEMHLADVGFYNPPKEHYEKFKQLLENIDKELI